MKNIAIIPARGGSKRIPKKNIRNFLGKPIIAYSIEAAINSGLFNEVMVSTDDKEIAEIAIKYGAKVPFLRSAKNSDDFATTVDVIKEVLNIYSTKFDNACCIYPTAPFVNNISLGQAYNKLIKYKYDSVFPIVPYSYPIQRSLETKGEKISMVWKEHIDSRSQDLEKRFHDAGQFYWFNIPVFLNKEVLFTDNTGYLEMNELVVQDIDTDLDWKLAELKYSLING